MGEIFVVIIIISILGLMLALITPTPMAGRGFPERRSKQNPNIDGGERKIWYNRAGQVHRDGAPAVIDEFMKTQFWLQNGMFHREDGPAIINGNMSHWFFKDEEYTFEEWVDKIAKGDITKKAKLLLQYQGITQWPVKWGEQ